MKTNAFVGIDFGTSTCCAAWYDPQTGRAEVISNAAGENKTPSVLYFDESKTLVGAVAEEMIDSTENRGVVVRNIKRQLASDLVRQFGDRKMTTVQMASVLIQKIRVDAEQGHFHGQGIDRLTHAVITYPASFDTTELEALRDAAHAAGFEAVEFLHEPVAAAIAYSRQGLAVGQFVFVYDLGGGTFDLALLARDDLGAFRLGAQPFSDKRGGEDFDRLIYTHFDRTVRQKTQAPLCRDGLDLRFLRECRKIKTKLSDLENWDFTWTSAANGPVALSIRRDEFEKLIEPDIDKTVRQTLSAYREAEGDNQNVESVILIGGSSRIPLIERKLREALPIPPLKWSKQDVAVALGAAYHAAAIWGGAKATTFGGRGSFASAAGKIPAFEPGSKARSLLKIANELIEKASGVRDANGQVQALQKSQLLMEAASCAEAASEREPKWHEPIATKAKILMEQEQYTLASAAWTVCLRLELSPTDAMASYLGRGRCEYLSSDLPEAKDDYDRALNRDFAGIEPGNVGLALSCRSQVNWKMKEVDACVADLEKHAEVTGHSDPGVLALLGAILADDKRNDARAFEMFSKSLTAYPTQETDADRFAFDGAFESFGLGSRLTVEPLPGDRSIQAIIPVLSLQKRMWQLCTKKHNGCTQAAVEMFIDANSHPEVEKVWGTEERKRFLLLVQKVRCDREIAKADTAQTRWDRALANWNLDELDGCLLDLDISIKQPGNTDPGSLTVMAVILQDRKKESRYPSELLSKALQLYRPAHAGSFHDKFSQFGLLAAVELKSSRVSPVLSMQKRLWGICRADYKGCTERAVELFLDASAYEPEPELWSSGQDGNFPFYVSKIGAGRGIAQSDNAISRWDRALAHWNLWNVDGCITDLEAVAKFQNDSDSATLAILGVILQDRKLQNNSALGMLKKALELYRDSDAHSLHNKFQQFGLHNSMALSDTGTVKAVLSLQKRMWQVIRKEHEGCKELAVADLLDASAKPLMPEVWADSSDSNFPHYLARIIASRSIAKRDTASARWDRVIANWNLNDCTSAITDLEAYVRLSPKPDAGTVAILGRLAAGASYTSVDAIEMYRRELGEYADWKKDGFTHVCTTFGQQAQLKSEKSDPVLLVQKWLWEACKSARGGCSQAAVDLFCESSERPVSSIVWEAGEFQFRLYAAIYHFNLRGGSAPDASGLGWFEKYFADKNALPTIVLQQIRVIVDAARRTPALKKLLTPTAATAEQHGNIDNFVVITNTSAFRITNVKVTVSYNHTVGGRKTSTHTVGQVEPGQAHSWPNAFTDVGIFTSKISGMLIAWTCDEKQGIFS